MKHCVWRSIQTSILLKAFYTSRPGRFIQWKPSLFCEPFSYPNERKQIYLLKYAPLSIAMYSFVQMSEQKQCRVNELAKIRRINSRF